MKKGKGKDAFEAKGGGKMEEKGKGKDGVAVKGGGKMEETGKGQESLEGKGGKKGKKSKHGERDELVATSPEAIASIEIMQISFRPARPIAPKSMPTSSSSSSAKSGLKKRPSGEASNSFTTPKKAAHESWSQ